ncbi:MAG: type I-E CRISPR-associated protein Cas6/Cse3/CasE [Pseudomonadota bacterium]
MYFSKVQIALSPESLQLLSNGKSLAYAAHKSLWQLFTEEEKRQFLFREETQKNGIPMYFLLSEKPPEQHPGFIIQTKSFAPKLAVGDQLAYQIRVNPTVTTRLESGKRERHDVLMHAKKKLRDSEAHPETIKQEMEDAARHWFAYSKRLQEWGFELSGEPYIEKYYQHKLKKNSRRIIQFSSVDLQGQLTVTQPDAFLKMLCTGIGRSKAFGCGLMMVRRV